MPKPLLSPYSRLPVLCLGFPFQLALLALAHLVVGVPRGIFPFWEFAAGAVSAIALVIASWTTCRFCHVLD